MIAEYLNDAETRMKGAVNSLHHDMGGFRTGRASTTLVDRLTVEMYGSDLPLKQIASTSVPEPQQIAIRPYDASSVAAIERAILKSDLGLTPNNDGKIIRLNIPQLTQERRRDLSKQLGKRVESAKVAVRNVRRDVQHDIREMQDEKMVSEDEARQGLDNLQKLTDKYVGQIDKMGKEKDAEIMEV